MNSQLSDAAEQENDQGSLQWTCWSELQGEHSLPSEQKDFMQRYTIKTKLCIPQLPMETSKLWESAIFLGQLKMIRTKNWEMDIFH